MNVTVEFSNVVGGEARIEFMNGRIRSIDYPLTNSQVTLVAAESARIIVQDGGSVRFNLDVTEAADPEFLKFWLQAAVGTITVTVNGYAPVATTSTNVEVFTFIR